MMGIVVLSVTGLAIYLFFKLGMGRKLLAKRALLKAIKGQPTQEDDINSVGKPQEKGNNMELLSTVVDNASKIVSSLYPNVPTAPEADQKQSMYPTWVSNVTNTTDK
jgi:hypothetical protein